MRATYPTHISLFDLTTLIVFDAKEQITKLLTVYFLSVCSPLGPNIVPSATFSNTPNICKLFLCECTN